MVELISPYLSALCCCMAIEIIGDKLRQLMFGAYEDCVYEPIHEGSHSRFASSAKAHNLYKNTKALYAAFTQ